MNNSESRFTTTNQSATVFCQPVTWDLASLHLPMKHVALAQDIALQLAQLQEVQGHEAT